MKIQTDKATQVLLEESTRAATGDIKKNWASKIEQLGELCDTSSRTHIAAFATAALAKATDIDVDVHSLKRGQQGPRAYSARSLAKDVVAKQAPLLGIDIGVSGAEPLNNQPYFRESRITRQMPVKSNSRGALEHLCDMLDSLERIDTEQEARAVLRTFIHVRRLKRRTYLPLSGPPSCVPSEIPPLIEQLVHEASEGGKRAQAATAAVFDVAYGIEHISTGRVNDPSRRSPGDISVVVPSGHHKSVEVRDKHVDLADVYRFAKRCVDAGIHDVFVVAVARGQAELDPAALRAWQREHGATVTVIYSWRELVHAAVLWRDLPASEAATALIERVHQRLVTLEASERAVNHWRELTSKLSDEGGLGP